MLTHLEQAFVDLTPARCYNRATTDAMRLTLRHV